MTNNQDNAAVELSIILISYNTSQITKDTIESIYNSLKDRDTSTYELIVLDNASTDGSVQMLRDVAKVHSNVKFIESKENLGFSKGNNRAFEQSKGTYVLFINSDIIVIDDAIEQLLHYYQQNDNHVHFLGGKLFNQDKSPQPSCGPFYVPWVVFGALFLKGDHWGLTRSSPNKPKQVDWVSGACIMTKRDIFEEIGKFDEDIFMYMEEIDLLYRARQKGYNTYFYPKAKFTHLGSASSGGRTYPILQVYKGFLYFYNKHYKHDVATLKGMLQLKAQLALLLGKLTHNQYLITTYEKAYQMASMAG